MRMSYPQQISASQTGASMPGRNAEGVGTTGTIPAVGARAAGPKRYPQLDDRAIGLLSARVVKLGTKAAVAAELGVTRTAVSQALARKYPADTRKLRAKIVERYADGIACPHLNRDLSPSDCRSYRTRDLPTGSRESVKHWQACRSCPHNPENKP